MATETDGATATPRAWSPGMNPADTGFGASDAITGDNPAAGVEMRTCAHCGFATTAKQVSCSRCGVWQAPPAPEKPKRVAAIQNTALRRLALVGVAMLGALLLALLMVVTLPWFFVRSAWAGLREFWSDFSDGYQADREFKLAILAFMSMWDRDAVRDPDATWKRVHAFSLARGWAKK